MALRGKVEFTPVRFRAGAKCWGCGALFMREVEQARIFADLLGKAGWAYSEILNGWNCSECKSRNPRAKPGVREDELLTLLLSGEKWKPTLLAKRMGISRARIYQLRGQLEAKGRIEPLRRRSSRDEIL